MLVVGGAGASQSRTQSVDSSSILKEFSSLTAQMEHNIRGVASLGLPSLSLRRLVAFSMTSSVSFRKWQPLIWIFCALTRVAPLQGLQVAHRDLSCLQTSSWPHGLRRSSQHQDDLSDLPQTQRQEQEERCIACLKLGASRKRASSRARSEISRRRFGLEPQGCLKNASSMPQD